MDFPWTFPVGSYMPPMTWPYYQYPQQSSGFSSQSSVESRMFESSAGSEGYVSGSDHSTFSVKVPTSAIVPGINFDPKSASFGEKELRPKPYKARKLKRVSSYYNESPIYY